jgi:hypothetical protein
VNRVASRACALLLCAAFAAVAPPAPAEAATRDRVLTGTVADQDGHVVAGADVVLEDDAALSGIGLLMCLFPPFALFPGICFPHSASARTDAHGRYRLVLKGGSELASPGLRHLQVLGRAASGGPARPTFRGDLRLTTATRALPAVQLWTRPVSLARKDRRTTFTLVRPRGATGTASLFLRADDAKSLAYALPVKDGRAEVDDRVLEVGTRGIDGRVAGTWAAGAATWTSPSLPVPTMGPPASRGLRCGTYAKGGAPVQYPTCPFTDGHLGTALGLLKALALAKGLDVCEQERDCAAPNALVLDLGSLQQLDAVVWRGCSFCSVQLSLDGTTWLDWPDEQREGSSDAITTGDPFVVRYVRVQGNVFLTWDLREVSVWARPLLSVPPLPPARPTTGVDLLPAQPMRVPVPGAPDLPHLLAPITRLAPS